jgi:hypothetical protein
MKRITENRPTYTATAQRKVDQADARTRFALERFRDAQIKEFREFWNQPRQDIIDQLAIRGNKAIDAFTMHASSVAFVIEQGINYPSADYTPPMAYTAHTTGELAGHITLD